MTAWEMRVDEAIRRTEATGVSRIRMIPIDMVADAVAAEIGFTECTDRDIQIALGAVMHRNNMPMPFEARC